MKAIEVSKPERTTLHSRPVFSKNIMQRPLHRLTAPCDVRIKGIYLRLPIGCVLSITAGGADGLHGSLMVDVNFVALDGQTYRATTGQRCLIASNLAGWCS